MGLVGKVNLEIYCLNKYWYRIFVKFANQIYDTESKITLVSLPFVLKTNSSIVIIYKIRR